METLSAGVLWHKMDAEINTIIFTYLRTCVRREIHIAEDHDGRVATTDRSLALNELLIILS